MPVSVLPRQLIKMVKGILLQRGRDGQGRLPDVSRENKKQGQLRSLGREERSLFGVAYYRLFLPGCQTQEIGVLHKHNQFLTA